MAEMVQYPLEDGGVLLVQAAAVDAAPDGLGLASPTEEKAKKAAETLESALSSVMPALKSVTEKLRNLSPSALEVGFGLTLTAETGIVVAKGSAEVHFAVTVTWSKDASVTDGAAPADGAPGDSASPGKG
jgi:hypothetical protein